MTARDFLISKGMQPNPELEALLEEYAAANQAPGDITISTIDGSDPLSSPFNWSSGNQNNPGA